jgi:hypothetical protein
MVGLRGSGVSCPGRRGGCRGPPRVGPRVPRSPRGSADSGFDGPGRRSCCSCPRRSIRPSGDSFAWSNVGSVEREIATPSILRAGETLFYYHSLADIFPTTPTETATLPRAPGTLGLTLPNSRSVPLCPIYPDQDNVYLFYF